MKSIISDYPPDELQALLDSHESIKDILIAMGAPSGCGQYRTLQKKLKNGNYDLTQFKLRSRQLRKRLMDNLKTNNKIDHGTIFVKDSRYECRKSIKKKLVNDYNRPYQCEVCGNLGSHMGKPMTLQLDHINGDRHDNRLENLRFLCPNCHSQTETFCGARKNYYACISCGKNKSTNTKQCNSCSKIDVAARKRSKDIGRKGHSWDFELIIEKVLETNWVKAGEYFEVSDNALRKRLKKAGYDIKNLK